ncbi:MAG: hypothetical protein E7331_03760 [Clostridiales bacterium]|nr:hypothetical protein [Clostridiales bacterium]
MKGDHFRPSLPFLLTGTVQQGKALGSQLGFPTANIAYRPEGQGFPENGVYVAVARLKGENYLAILNQGYHPTLPEGMPTVEAHLIGLPWQPLYGEELCLEYRHFLRPEQAFPSLEALRSQLDADRESALVYAGEHCPELIPGAYRQR